MTDEQRKSVALEYLKAFDNKGVTSNGGSILDLFADDAQVFFPKWGLANGKPQIGQLFTDFGGNIKSILHDYATFNFIMTGTDVFAVEGTSAGVHKEGPWRAGVSHAGRWCDVFEVRDFLIQRCFIYLDPITPGSTRRVITGCRPAGACVETHGIDRAKGKGKGKGLNRCTTVSIAMIVIAGSCAVASAQAPTARRCKRRRVGRAMRTRLPTRGPPAARRSVSFRRRPLSRR
jgi:hypothetical protein